MGTFLKASERSGSEEAATADAPREHALHRAGSYSFLQGAFVVPAGRLGELLKACRCSFDEPPDGLRARGVLA